MLDIGAGPGTLAIPLSPLVKEITAVEPGAGMVEILRKHAEAGELTQYHLRAEDLGGDRSLLGSHRPV